MSAAVFPARCIACGGTGHTGEQSSALLRAPLRRTPTTAPPGPCAASIASTRSAASSTDERPPQGKPRGTKRAPPTVWTPELGPCRNEDSAGKCGKNHLHKDCPKRAAANAAAAAKKAVAGAKAYVAELHSDEDDSIVFVEIPAALTTLFRPKDRPRSGGRDHGRLGCRRRCRLHRPGASALRLRHCPRRTRSCSVRLAFASTSSVGRGIRGAASGPVADGTCHGLDCLDLLHHRHRCCPSLSLPPQAAWHLEQEARTQACSSHSPDPRAGPLPRQRLQRRVRREPPPRALPEASC
jgi:hypothetical protein